MDKKSVFRGFAARANNAKLRNDLEVTLAKNERAVDFFTNELTRAQDRYKAFEKDEDKSAIENLEYIVFALTFLDTKYRESLKRC